MGRSYKNFWSLNTDEAVVAGILRDSLQKNVEILMPLNAQMKDVDLIIMNMDNKKTLKIQVKGSRSYEPRKNEIKKYEDGSAGWFYFKKDIIHKNTADFFIFLIYVIEESKKTGRRIIKPHTLTIPTKKLVQLCKKYKKIDKSDRYNFLFWINPVKNQSFEFKDERYDTTEYLDKSGLDKLNQKLK
jgi:hypothetical protein